MGKLRTGDTDQFPVESRSDGINYILIPPQPQEEVKTRYDRDAGEVVEYNHTSYYYHFKATKGAKESLLKRLREIGEDSEWRLVGTWEGKWRTDTFDLDVEEFRRKMEQAEL